MAALVMQLSSKLGFHPLAQDSRFHQLVIYMPNEMLSMPE